MDPSNDCTWPEIRRRVHYVGWLAAAIGAMALVGLTAELVVVKATGGTVRFDLVPLIYLCAIVPSYVYVWRKHAEANCGFLELEHALKEAMEPLGPGGGSRFAELVDLVGQIEAARGLERQLVRNEAKKWLMAHAGQLGREEREYVAVNLGYLGGHRDDQPPASR